MALISDLLKYSRLAIGLRSFLHGTITLEASKQRIAERLRNREKNFLSLMQKGIYQNPKSPFRKLLELAGGDNLCRCPARFQLCCFCHRA